MTFNPYAPPSDPSQFVAAPGPEGGGPLPWEPGEVLSAAWEIVKVHWPVLIFGPFVGEFIAAMPGQVFSGIGVAMDDVQVAQVMNIVGTLIGLAAGAFFNVGITRVFLSAARGEQPRFGDIFSGGNRFLALLGAQLLVGLCILVGFILLIIPGIYASLALSQTNYYVIDKNMGPIEAMQASWRATEGQKGNIFLYGLLSLLVLIAGMIACCVGLFPAGAVVGLGMAIIYTRISGTTGSSQFQSYGGPPGGGGWQGPPGGGYGPPGGGYGGPPGGGYAPPGGGYGPPGGGYGPPGGGYGGPPGGGYGPGAGYGPPGGGYGPPGGG
ncbi:MAG: hypothetical protein HOV80_31410 [Polyangiaceae bacterium]|nr:hypothetical protein [Polyangiaceae bacterium]